MNRFSCKSIHYTSHGGEVHDAILQHPLFWPIDRLKCFLLDIADSRKAFRQEELPSISKGWTTFVKQSQFKGFFGEAEEHYRTSKSNDPKNKANPGTPDARYKEGSIMDLVIFVANVVNRFLSPFRFVTLSSMAENKGTPQSRHQMNSSRSWRRNLARYPSYGPPRSLRRIAACVATGCNGIETLPRVFISIN